MLEMALTTITPLSDLYTSGVPLASEVVKEASSEKEKKDEYSDASEVMSEPDSHPDTQEPIVEAPIAEGTEREMSGLDSTPNTAEIGQQAPDTVTKMEGDSAKDDLLEESDDSDDDILQVHD